MKISSVLAPLVLLALAGCGGDTSSHTNEAKTLVTTVNRPTVATGGTAIAEVGQTGYGDDVTYALTVQEGDAGGTLTIPDFDGPVAGGIERLYNAPATPGTYHIVGTVTEKGGKVHTKTTTVTVEVAPAS